ncbi:MAG: KH domain-containing protein [Lachnospirales bacterium]
MEETLVFMAKKLVDNPEEVSVIREVKEDNTIVLKLRVAQEDMGKVIGKQGKIAKAMRSIIKVIAIRENQRVVVDIID